MAQPFISDVFVWHQGDRPITLADCSKMPGHRVWLTNSPRNLYTYGRFMASRHCTRNLIITCDDDVAVHNWREIYDTFHRDPEVITAALRYPGHYNADANNRWGESCHEVLLGFGSMFNRSWITDAFDAYLERYGHDEVLLRKADRLFGMLLNRRHQVIKADFEELPGATDPAVALYHRPDHYKLTRVARQRALGILGIPIRGLRL